MFVQSFLTNYEIVVTWNMKPLLSIFCLFTSQYIEQTSCFNHNAALNENPVTADRCKHFFFHKVLTLWKHELQERPIQDIKPYFPVSGSGYSSRYSDSLRAGWAGDRITVVAVYLYPTRPALGPSIYLNNRYRVSFWKVTEKRRDLTTHATFLEFKEKV